MGDTINPEPVYETKKPSPITKTHTFFLYHTLNLTRVYLKYSSTFNAVQPLVNKMAVFFIPASSPLLDSSDCELGVLLTYL